jgi:hypothetical protein
MHQERIEGGVRRLNTPSNMEGWWRLGRRSLPVTTPPHTAEKGEGGIKSQLG